MNGNSCITAVNHALPLLELRGNNKHLSSTEALLEEGFLFLLGLHLLRLLVSPNIDVSLLFLRQAKQPCQLITLGWVSHLTDITRITQTT